MLAPQFLTYRGTFLSTTAILSISSLLLGSSVCAQIVPDRTLNTQVDLTDGQLKITGGIQSGQNLFHSLQEFSPTADFVTHFDNNSDIQNIFTRVTGKSQSLIDGLIRTNGSTSLFILNPAGIIFGENAALDIGGSFITTTAESIIFADGTKFDTQINQTTALLTVSIPIGLQYGNSPGAISSNNNKHIQLDISPKNNILSGNTIAFLGGNITLQNMSVKAVSGNIEIGSVAEGEIINLSPTINGWKFNYNNVNKFNDIIISNDIKVSQESKFSTSGKSGNINFRGKDIILNPGVNIENLTNTDFDGGDISLLATKYIDLNNILLSTPVAAGFDENGNPLEHQVTGKGGDTIIEAREIKIIGGSVISATTLDLGAGGNILIDASKSLELTGFNEFRPSLILSAVTNNGAGGNVQINTGELVIADGSRIDSSSFGLGRAGTIIVNAHESISISGKNRFLSSNFGQELEFNSGLVASSGFEGLLLPNLGESGNLIINTPRLLIQDGGEISVSNFGFKDAGDITINGEEILLKDDSQIISKRASGNEGSIDVDTSEILLKDNSTIATTAEGNGDGGNITLAADNIVMFDHSSINADAQQGRGGKIAITTQSLLTQENPEEMITASSQFGVNGVVEINTPNTSSKLETTQARIAPIAGEESIDTSCALGNDFSANRFVYIGRGGIRKGPFDESEDSQEVIGDLGLEELPVHAFELSSNNRNIIENTPKSIVEATNWIVNEHGNVELIAQASNSPLPSGCLFNPS